MSESKDWEECPGCGAPRGPWWPYCTMVGSKGAHGSVSAWRRISPAGPQAPSASAVPATHYCLAKHPLEEALKCGHLAGHEGGHASYRAGELPVTWPAVPALPSGARRDRSSRLAEAARHGAEYPEELEASTPRAADAASDFQPASEQDSQNTSADAQVEGARSAGSPTPLRGTASGFSSGAPSVSAEVEQLASEIDQALARRVALQIVEIADLREQRAAAEAAAYARGLADGKFSPLGDNHHNAAACPYCGDLLRAAEAARDARWREALRAMVDLAQYHVFAIDEIAESDPTHENIERAKRANADYDAAEALLGSGAAEAQPPPSASVALAGSEEPTPKEKK